VVGNAKFGGQFSSPTPAGGAVAPGAGAPTGSIDIGKYTPDWKNLIGNDPGLLSAQSLLAAGSSGDLASRNASIQRALIQFGKVPDFKTLAQQLGMSEADIQDALGPDIQRLAQENTDAGLSTESRLSTANTDAMRQIKNELNKRGLLNSGETGYQLDKQQTGYRQAESDANSKLLDYLNQYQQGYAQAQQSRAQQLAGQYSAAADRQFASNSGAAGQPASWDHTDANGTHVYKTSDGRLWNADGTPYTGAPTAAAPSAPAPPRYAPPDSLVGNAQYGGQYSGTNGTRALMV
jgi:hypothetical protein